MTYKCWQCGEEFEDGDEYARHVEAEHKDQDVGVHVEDSIDTDDLFG